MSEINGIKIFSGNSNPKLAKGICQSLGIEPGKARVSRFSDGEIRVEINENVRKKEVFVVQGAGSLPGVSPNDYLMELMLMADALRRASAKEITAVIPCFFYARQDRKNRPRVPISAKVVAKMLEEVAEVVRILTMDLHAGQIQGFVDIPVDNLYASPIILPFIRNHFQLNDLVIVAPDAGGVPRARSYARNLGVGLAMIDKRRPDANQAEVLNIIGEVEGKTAVVLDDMADTLGTLMETTKSLKDRGAKSVSACVTHPILSGAAIERLEESCLDLLAVTNTVPLSLKASQCSKIKVIPAEGLFAAAIERIHQGEVLNDLFEIQN